MKKKDDGSAWDALNFWLLRFGVADPDQELRIAMAELEALSLAVAAAVSVSSDAKTSIAAVFQQHLDVLLEHDMQDKEVAALFHEALERRLAWLESLPGPE